MMERQITTPFGGARMTARDFSRQKWIAHRQSALADGTSTEQGVADKWQLLRDLTEARQCYLLSDRSINVLEALLSFHPSRSLNGKAPIIVFPSNAELSIRARGMSPATLRRHLAALVNAGLIIRRDSPNGKRYCRRNGNGMPAEAFGFDLAPLALLATEICAAARQVRTEQQARRQLRSQITVHLRDIAKILAAAVYEGRQGDWEEYRSQLSILSSRLPTKADTDTLQERFDEIIRLRSIVENTYLAAISDPEMSANVRDYEHHIQNSKTEITSESDCSENLDVTIERDKSMPTTVEKRTLHPVELTLRRVLDACPQISDYAKADINTWPELVAAASVVRLMLGIAPASWEKACKTMGSAIASVVIAAILERAQDIRSASAYFHALTQQAAKGRLSVISILRALE